MPWPQICIPLPEGASLKDICVHITTSSVKVEVCGESKLEGRLGKASRHDMAMHRDLAHAVLELALICV